MCHKCQKEIEPPERVGRKDTCPFCGAELHCCFNCKFYDLSAHNKCREPNSEWVSDREKGNFCDYFSLADKAGKAPEAKVARTKAEALFKKG
ncbi:MAG: hypothetical protein JSU92_11290 [Deltaproteobacteria bacterium]|nr:MAG: hypothetical protein JSU92_11290 [Deltaproteobacteria bacterium]